MDEAFEKNEKDIQMNPGTGGKNTLMAILSYIGPLVIVSYIVAKDDPFVKFHIKQGLLLLILWVAVMIVGSMFWWYGLYIVWSIVRLGILILSVIGIVYAAQGKEKALPLIGQYSKYLSF